MLPLFRSKKQQLLSLVFVVKCVRERNRDEIGRCVRMKKIAKCESRMKYSNSGSDSGL